MLRHSGFFTRAALAALIFLLPAGCQSQGKSDVARKGDDTAQARDASNAGATSAMPIAFIAGTPVRWTDVQAAMTEAAGGQVLAERVLDLQIARRLDERDLKVTPEQIEAERALYLKTLGVDADQGERMLRRVREDQGLGEQRFKDLLARNAGLRLLVRDEASVPESAVRQEYDLRYGPRYQARVIVMDSLPALTDVVRRAKAGESFADLAVQHSADASRSQGGLLSPISPADPTWPVGMRNVLPALKVGDVSDPVALDAGYAVLKLERKIDAREVKFDDVKSELEPLARRQIETVLMRQLARTLMTQAEVVVLDKAMNQSWQQQKQRLAPTASVGQ